MLLMCIFRSILWYDRYRYKKGKSIRKQKKSNHMIALFAFILFLVNVVVRTSC
ncbi:MAG TPA: hypothetical protein DCO67_05900 [Staphylococcus sp.]|nr:hypothetical protein [Staphylococcus sp.]